jgi:hypothetical protein
MTAESSAEARPKATSARRPAGSRVESGPRHGDGRDEQNLYIGDGVSAGQTTLTPLAWGPFLPWTTSN